MVRARSRKESSGISRSGSRFAVARSRSAMRPADRSDTRADCRCSRAVREAVPKCLRGLPRVAPREIAPAKAREARRGHAREESGTEITRLEERHALEVAALEQEIQRLRRMLTAVTRD